MLVPDASAHVDAVTAQPNRAAIAQHFTDQLHAPAHQLAEVASAVVRMVRAGDLTAGEARQALADATALKQYVTPLDDGLMQRAFSLRDSIGIADGLYVALAERLNCPLLTTDGRLARANPPCEVVYVG
jgi:predicted nucleic acid-binding protein